MFHQAGANAKGEYSTIIPKLLTEGFNVFAVDQRTGGQTFGKHNRTVAEISANRYGYCDAYPDLEAALNMYMILVLQVKKLFGEVVIVLHWL